MKLNELKQKRVLILGFGKEGRDTLKFLKKNFPKKVIGIADQKEFSIFPPASPCEARRAGNFQFPNLIKKDKHIRLHLGKNYLKALKNYDVIIKSPGVPPKAIKPFITGKQRITSQTEIFFESCPGKIVGVTGTKGKGTTTSLIYKILKEGGIPVCLVGNIGKPVLNLLLSPKKIYAYELSSHQLYNLKKSPQIAVFLNISRAHLDYFKNFNEYVRAKANITKHQTKENFLIYNPRDKIVKQIAEKSKAKKIPIPVNFQFQRIPNKLVGKFNLQNAAAAIMVAKIFGISEKNIIKAIKGFKPLLHRLEPVGKYKMIKFYNDSAATIPEATINALLSLGKNVQTIILGGYESNIRYKNLAKQILKNKVKNLIFFPPSGKKIWREIIKICRGRASAKLPNHFFVDNMAKAVRLAYQYTAKGKICLLSCASPSFGIFKDYKQRGNLFKKYVKRFARNSAL